MRTRLIAYEGTAFNPDHGTDDGAACSMAGSGGLSSVRYSRPHPRVSIHV